MKITINYKTGVELKRLAHNCWVEDDSLYFTVKCNPTPIFITPTKVPLSVINSFSVEEFEDGGCPFIADAGVNFGDAEVCYGGLCWKEDTE